MQPMPEEAPLLQGLIGSRKGLFGANKIELPSYLSTVYRWMENTKYRADPTATYGRFSTASSCRLVGVTKLKRALWHMNRELGVLK